MRFLDNVATVDPGWNTAVALFTSAHGIHPQTWFFSHKAIKDNIQKMNALADDFALFLDTLHPRKVIFEDVGLWGSDARSMVSAQRGDTFGLAMLIGMYMRECFLRGIPVSTLTPIQWKGNASKDIIRKRVQLRLGADLANEHIYDAVGIGLSVMGVL